MTRMDAAAAPSNSIHLLTRAGWRAWLEEHHGRAEGVWLITYKKATGKPRVACDEAVEEALCYGRVDSRPNRLDEERSHSRPVFDWKTDIDGAHENGHSPSISSR
jgi:uncharacterized protein YdeI (YjbR/CyaY-like superfamily)